MSFAGRIKQLASETAIYGISSIVARMIGFLLFPFYSHAFGPELYGVVTKVYATFIFLNILYQYGMESAYLKFASDTDENSKTVFSTATWSLLGSTLLLSGAMVGFKEGFGCLIGLTGNWLFLVYYAAAILTLDAFTIIPFAALRLQNQPLRFAAIRLFSVILNVGLNLWFIFGLEWGIESIFIANVVASGASLLLLLPTYGHGFDGSFDGGLWKNLMRFGLPFLPGGLGYAVSDRINIFYLGKMPEERVLDLYGDHIDTSRLSSEAPTVVADPISECQGLFAFLEGGTANVYADYVVGVFGGITKLAIFMMLLSQMFRYAWQPFFLQRAKDPDAPALFARIFSLFTAVGLLVWLSISFFAQEIVALPIPGFRDGSLVWGPRTLVQERYWLGLFIVPISLLGYLFMGWYYNFSAGAYLKKKTAYFVPCTLVGATLALFLNTTLVPTYGMLGAAWATTVSFGVMAIMLYMLLRKHYPIPYAWGRIIGMAGVAGALFLAWHQLSWLQTIAWELGLLAVFVASLLALGVLPCSVLTRLKARF